MKEKCSNIIFCLYFNKLEMLSTHFKVGNLYHRSIYLIQVFICLSKSNPAKL